MAEYYFVVAFGHGADVTLTCSSEEVATALRRLLDRACDATFGGFPNDVLTSVAPGGVMLAFPDATPDRALQLCKAVESQLDHSVKTQMHLTPVCAAITCGPMRTVDVLGYHTNFEGRPAIAAARILAKLPSGQVAVDQSVWGFTSLLRELDAEQRLPGKHQGEGFVIRVHKHLSFSTSKDNHLPGCNKPSQRKRPHNPPPTDARTNRYLVKRWQMWVATLATLVTIGIFLLWEPMQTLSGVIQDENGGALSGVVVELPEFQLTISTDSSGKFTFRVKAPKQHPVNFVARKEGYITYNIDPRLGNTSLNFILRRER